MKKIKLRGGLEKYKLDENDMIIFEQIKKHYAASSNVSDSINEKLEKLHYSLKSVFFKDVIFWSSGSRSPLFFNFKAAKKSFQSVEKPESLCKSKTVNTSKNLRTKKSKASRTKVLPYFSEVICDDVINNEGEPNNFQDGLVLNNFSELFSSVTFQYFYELDLILDTLFKIRIAKSKGEQTAFEYIPWSEAETQSSLKSKLHIQEKLYLVNNIKERIKSGDFIMPVDLNISLSENNRNILITPIAANFQNRVLSHYASSPWYFKNKSFHLDSPLFLNKQVRKYSYSRLLEFTPPKDSGSPEDFYLFEKTTGFNLTIAIYRHLKRVLDPDAQDFFKLYLTAMLPNMPNTYGRFSLINTLMLSFTDSLPYISTDAVENVIKATQYFFQNNPYSQMRKIYWNLLIDLFINSHLGFSELENELDSAFSALKERLKFEYLATDYVPSDKLAAIYPFILSSEKDKHFKSFANLEERVIHSILHLGLYQKNHLYNITGKCRKWLPNNNNVSDFQELISPQIEYFYTIDPAGTHTL